MSLNKAAKFLGVGLSTSHRWANEGCPTSISILLRLMIALDVTPDWVNKKIGRTATEDQPRKARVLIFLGRIIQYSDGVHSSSGVADFYFRLSQVH
jgi:hypothetical protein